MTGKPGSPPPPRCAAPSVHAAYPFPRLPSSSTVQPSPSHFHATIRHAAHIAPGPDGIPFLAWKTLDFLGARILHDAFYALTHLDADDRPDHRPGDTPTQLQPDTPSSHHFHDDAAGWWDGVLALFIIRDVFSLRGIYTLTPRVERVLCC